MSKNSHTKVSPQGHPEETMTQRSGEPVPRAPLAGIPAYVPGRPADLDPDQPAFMLSSNENPFPPLPSVMHALAKASSSINRYPDFSAGGLRTVLAAELDVAAEDIAAGGGSVGVLQQIIRAYAGLGDEVIFAWRSFEAYPVLVQESGARPVKVPLNGADEHDLEAMLDAITPVTKIIMVCLPNNPTGPSIRHDQLKDFVSRVPPNILIVLDEAYREFVTGPDLANAMDFYRDRDNVAVLRTFSKAFGLAGLRVGYVVARRTVIDAVRKTGAPFAVNSLAEVGAIASLKAHGELLQRVRSVVAERTRVASALAAQGWTVPDPQGNFVWLGLGDASSEFAGACAAVGVIVRPFAGEGVRVSIGAPPANDAFLLVASEWNHRRVESTTWPV